MTGAEWQRRRTLRSVLQAAPPGTVVDLGAGPGGPTLRVRVGAHGDPRARRR
ncbi:hypothetical protein [Streptomyces sp. G45]|uniref:hypothetical protein n=1 Tax=Streptomyces sp. G45 TaxID=3406627 RepID=UPI003C23981A